MPLLKQTNFGCGPSKHAIAALLRRPALFIALAFCAIAATAQQCPIPFDPTIEIYPKTPKYYPVSSNKYSVEYSFASPTGVLKWIPSQVYISDYGATDASPYHTYSKYLQHATSMSFTSIPVKPDTAINLRITKLWGLDFPPAAQVSIRPAIKGVQIVSVNGDTIEIAAGTAKDFLGEQFILWWDQLTDVGESAGVEALAFFLDPIYQEPKGLTVKKVTEWSDLADVSSYEVLDFEPPSPGASIVLGTATAAGPAGATAYPVPPNITSVFLGPGAWVQGKLRFQQTGKGVTRRLYGPGVLDASRFNYSYRQCRNNAIFHDQGYSTVSIEPLPTGKAGAGLVPDIFHLDGVVLSDGNFYGTDMITGGHVNNIKIMSWNGNNDGLELGDSSIATNVFTRVSDDSIKMWGEGITVRNATVWQNFNGGVVNLGWASEHKGDGDLIDGLYVVKLDWHSPSAIDWNADTLSGDLDSQNNAVFDSMMTPGTEFGAVTPPVFKNIYIQDIPHVLFSLKILPPDCGLKGQVKCPAPNLTALSSLNLNIEHLFTPPSAIRSSIGFQNVTADGFSGTLKGCMNIGLIDWNLVEPGGTKVPITSANAIKTGKISENGDNINLEFDKPVTPCTQAN